MAKKTTAKRNTKKTKVLENGLVLREEDMTILGLSEEERKKNPECIEIPEGVLAIKEEAFQNNHELKRVILPESLKQIGSYVSAPVVSWKKSQFRKELRSWRMKLLHTVRTLQKLSYMRG